MLTVWEAIKSRRSIRRFAPDDVRDEMINQMLEAASAIIYARKEVSG